MSIIHDLHSAHLERRARIWAAGERVQRKRREREEWNRKARQDCERVEAGAKEINPAPVITETPKRFRAWEHALAGRAYPMRTVSGDRAVMQAIKAMVCDFYGVSVLDIESSRLANGVPRVRQIAFYLGRANTRLSLPRIGAEFGGKDHSTVLYGVNKIAALREANAEFDAEIAALEAKIKGMGG